MNFTEAFKAWKLQKFLTKKQLQYMKPTWLAWSFDFSRETLNLFQNCSNITNHSFYMDGMLVLTTHTPSYSLSSIITTKQSFPPHSDTEKAEQLKSMFVKYSRNQDAFQFCSSTRSRLWSPKNHFYLVTPCSRNNKKISKKWQIVQQKVVLPLRPNER